MKPHAWSPAPPVAAIALALALTTSGGAARAQRIDGLGAPADIAAHVLRTHTLAKLGGGTLTLADLRGQVVVINFWASWCAPCRHELPRLAMLDAEIASRGGRVLAVSIDEDGRNVERFVQRNNLTLPVLVDGPNGLARELDLRNVPLTLVLGRSGEVAYATSRADEAGLNALVAATRQLIADRPIASTASVR